MNYTAWNVYFDVIDTDRLDAVESGDIYISTIFTPLSRQLNVFFCGISFFCLFVVRCSLGVGVFFLSSLLVISQFV